MFVVDVVTGTCGDDGGGEGGTTGGAMEGMDGGISVGMVTGGGGGTVVDGTPALKTSSGDEVSAGPPQKSKRSTGG